MMVTHAMMVNVSIKVGCVMVTMIAMTGRMRRIVLTQVANSYMCPHEFD